MRILILMMFTAALFAVTPEKLYDLYQNGQYHQACNEGIYDLTRYQQNEKFVSLYAFSCLYADRIDRLALPIVLLSKSEEARKNAAYLSLILTQKMLLRSALEGHRPLNDLKLPTTDTLLSKIFSLYCDNAGSKMGNNYTFKDPEDPRTSYRLYLDQRQASPDLIIEVYYDTIMTKRHTYR